MAGCRIISTFDTLMFTGLNILKESFVLSVQQLWANKMRAFLSLLGVTIGIFSIIAILTAVDALKNDISASINKLGDNIIFIQKWPWTFSTTSQYPWWEFVKRPEAKYNDYKLLRERTKKAEFVSFSIRPPFSSPSYRSDILQNVDAIGVTQDYGSVMQLEVTTGRYFSESESNMGLPVAIIGGGIAEEIFKSAEGALEKEIKVWGRKVKVIGVLKKEGQGGLLGNNNDKAIYVPYFFVGKVTNINPWEARPQIQARTKPGISLDELSIDIQSHMRAIRKLRPKELDDFALNKLSIIAQGFAGVFQALNMVGLIVGSFALIVGGFGIANIMYVSVTERTNIIGIKKAMGARKSYILAEFLLESVMLCIVGGLLGILMVWGLTGPATEASGMEFVLSWKNGFIGISISAIIGVLSGFLPARAASNLDAVEAIRAK
jgi:putative ABC transport system permease protein